MPTRRSTFAAAIAAVALAALALPAAALVASNFSAQNFADAQKAGKPILVDIYASWCPTCRAQAAVLKDLAKQDRFKNIVKLTVDFDGQKDVVKSLKASSQSTLIVFKGDKEVGRAVGETNAKAIEALLAKAL